MLKSRGIAVDAPASEFLREFNELQIHTPRGPFCFDIDHCFLYLGDTDIPVPVPHHG
jgi:hypothetical protein